MILRVLPIADFDHVHANEFAMLIKYVTCWLISSLIFNDVFCPLGMYHKISPIPQQYSRDIERSERRKMALSFTTVFVISKQ